MSNDLLGAFPEYRSVHNGFDMCFFNTNICEPSCASIQNMHRPHHFFKHACTTAHIQRQTRTQRHAPTHSHRDKCVPVHIPTYTNAHTRALEHSRNYTQNRALTNTQQDPPTLNASQNVNSNNNNDNNNDINDNISSLTTSCVVRSSYTKVTVILPTLVSSTSKSKGVNGCSSFRANSTVDGWPGGLIKISSFWAVRGDVNESKSLKIFRFSFVHTAAGMSVDCMTYGADYV